MNSNKIKVVTTHELKEFFTKEELNSIKQFLSRYVEYIGYRTVFVETKGKKRYIQRCLVNEYDTNDVLAAISRRKEGEGIPHLRLKAMNRLYHYLKDSKCQ